MLVMSVLAKDRTDDVYVSKAFSSTDTLVTLLLGNDIKLPLASAYSYLLLLTITNEFFPVTDEFAPVKNACPEPNIFSKLIEPPILLLKTTLNALPEL